MRKFHWSQIERRAKIHHARDISFEHSLAELEAVVHDLEEGQLGLTEALARYEQGVKHIKQCFSLLESAERKIELLTGVADDGTPRFEPFDESSQSPAESAGRRRRPKPNRKTDLRDEPNRDIDAQSPSTYNEGG